MFWFSNVKSWISNCQWSLHHAHYKHKHWRLKRQPSMASCNCKHWSHVAHCSEILETRMTFEEWKIKRRELSEQPFKMTCSLLANACVKVKKRQWKQKVVLVMATFVIIQMLVGKRNNIHHWIWESRIPN